MGLLELAGIVLILGVALPECVGAVGEGAGIVDIAEASAAEAGVGAAVGEAAVTKACAASPKAAVEAPETSAKAATTVEAAKTTAAEAAAAAECIRVFGSDREARGDRRAR
jgi:hypothetical protein